MGGLLLDSIEAIAIVNLVVSIAIAISPGYTPRQKIGQIVLVWLIPIVGSVVFGVFLWTQRGSAPPSRGASGAPDRSLALSEAAKSVEQQRG